ncbi:MAG: SGNH/GDSL hydrolase family protein [Planctomycetota bacterium]
MNATHTRSLPSARRAIATLLAVLGPATAALPAQEQPPEPPELRWIDARSLDLEGRAFADRAAPFDRLPARAETIVRAPVWELSRHSAGMAVRFWTDAPRIEARWTLTSDRLEMPHMPASGVSGLDLYVRTESGLRWVSATRPNKKQNQARLLGLRDRTDAPREYTLYLPLYNGIESLEIGVSADASFEGAPARPQPIVFYGTSITHGASASRPGTCHVAILGRRLDHPTVNLGFSGQGRMDAEIADLLAEIDAAVYVIDCLPNMTPALVAERAEPFLRRLRALRPETPVLLVEDRTFAQAPFVPGRLAEHEARRRPLRSAFERLRAEDGAPLGYLEGTKLLGADGDDTVDGSHPSDLGFWRQANAFEPALRALLSAR